jgi:hypothetical protein
MKEEEQLLLELHDMAAPITFTLDDEDRVALATQCHYWVDVQEEGEDNTDWHGSWEDEPLRSGLCWQLLPTEYKVFLRGTAYTCPKCHETDHTPMSITGRNQIGVHHLIHVGWPVAEAFLKGGLITEEHYRFESDVCIDCLTKEYNNG